MIPYTQLRKQPRIELAQAVPLAHPLTVFVEPTNLCNLASTCKWCPESLPEFFEKQRGKHHMSIADWETVADQMEQLGTVKQLHLYQLGEPLLNVNTPWFAAEA